jgi:DMSO reductase anchor subunit
MGLEEFPPSTKPKVMVGAALALALTAYGTIVSVRHVLKARHARALFAGCARYLAKEILLSSLRVRRSMRSSPFPQRFLYWPHCGS